MKAHERVQPALAYAEQARRIAEEAGMTVVMDDCIKRAVWRLLPPAR